MNEEELENEIIDKLLSERFDKPVKNGTMPCVIFSRQEFIKGMKYCFQKGKLEQKKEELKFLQKIESYCDDMKLKVGISILDDFNKYIKGRIKQLQKEIGGMKISEEKQDE